MSKPRISDRYKTKIAGLREQSKLALQVEAVKAEGYNAALDDVEKIIDAENSAD